MFKKKPTSWRQNILESVSLVLAHRNCGPKAITAVLGNDASQGVGGGDGGMKGLWRSGETWYSERPLVKVYPQLQ